MIIAILKSYLLNHKGLWCMYWAVQLIRMRISKLEEKKNTHTQTKLRLPKLFYTKSLIEKEMFMICQISIAFITTPRLRYLLA